MITLTKEQLINYIELLARSVNRNTILDVVIDVDEDDYCYVKLDDIIEIEGYLLTVFTDLEQEWLASK